MVSLRFRRARSPLAVVLLTLAVVVAAAGLAWLGFRYVSSGSGNGAAEYVAPSGAWKTYTSARFGFSLQYPEGWQVYEGDDPYVPVINIYPPIVSTRPPFDQATDVVSVSVFPQGIRNALILSQSSSEKDKTAGASGKLTSFTLATGETWALRFVPDAPPSSWKPWGFVWARAKVSNLAFGCMRKDKDIPYDDCAPNDGDDVVRRGTVDATSAKVVSQILESFTVTATSTKK